MIARAFRGVPALALLLAACATSPGEGSESRVVARAAAIGVSPQQEIFWSRLQALCGEAYAGRLLLAPPDDSWWGAERVVMHVRECTEREIRIALHIDENRSRTWVLTRNAAGLRLKHDHRLASGAPDTANTEYGGDTAGPGTIWRQEFPADAYSIGVVPARHTQTWYMEVRPGHSFAYGLWREETGLRYHLEFDLTQPVDAPPPPWGTEGSTGVEGASGACPLRGHRALFA
jgi:hypothetical protein